MFNSTQIEPFPSKVWLSSPTMHGDEIIYLMEAYGTNWVSTTGSNIHEVERLAAESSGVRYAVALSCCTASLHMAVKYAGVQLYGKPAPGHGALEDRRVFCPDTTFSATINPVLYEGGIPVFIDSESASWNMDPAALERAFAIYPDVKLVLYAQLYGFSGDIQKIKDICHQHGALLVEDTAEALGATWNGYPCGSFGDFAAVSYNGNKIITGSSGGCFLTNDPKAARKVQKWSTQSRENVSWYQHNEPGYNYRMSNLVAGMVRGQYPHLNQHIAGKKAIYEHYRTALSDLPIQMNPIVHGCSPNYWLSAMLIDQNAMCSQVWDARDVRYSKTPGKTCPAEILEALADINAEGRPFWKPMHLQPLYRANGFVSANDKTDISADLFQRGICLPSDNKMTFQQQDIIINVIRSCFE